MYIGIAIAAALVLFFIGICIVKCCCDCHCCCEEETDSKKSGKLGKSNRLSAKVRRTTSWIKTRSLPKAPCDEDTCIHSGCHAIADDRKLLKGPSGGKKKTNNDSEEGAVSHKKNLYMPSPKTKRSSRETLAAPTLTPPLKTFTFQPASGEEETYYSQPNLMSLSMSAGTGHTTIELFDLSTNSSNVLIVDDDDFDEFGDPDADDFCGKERSYSKLSYTTSDISHYQGLDINTLSKQNSTNDVDINSDVTTNDVDINSDVTSPLSPLPSLTGTVSLSDETNSVLYQSLDSPPYQTIEQYQKAYCGDISSNEYLAPSDGGSYQDMNLAKYSNPRAVSSYPYTNQYLTEQTSFSDSEVSQYVLPNDDKSAPQTDSAVVATKHYEITDAGSGIADVDYQNNYESSYLDLTAPDDEIAAI